MKRLKQSREIGEIIQMLVLIFVPLFIESIMKDE